MTFFEFYNSHIIIQKYDSGLTFFLIFHLMIQVKQFLLPGRFFMDNFFIVFPKTVDEALEKLIPVLTLKEKTKIVNMAEKDLFHLKMSLGFFIQSEYRLWGNDPLISDCKKIASENDLSYDESLMVIIWALWKKLQSENLLRVIK